MINPSKCLRLYKGGISRPNMNELFKNLELERGKILDITSKFEFVVNEIIQNKIIGYNLERPYLLDTILENIPFYARFGLLKELGLFDKDDRSFYKIKKLMDVRNKLAHQWNEVEAEYKNKPLSESFMEFKKDIEEAWKTFIEIHDKDQKEKLTRYVYEIDKGNYNSFLAD
jgi:hypothetical protein